MLSFLETSAASTYRLPPTHHEAVRGPSKSGRCHDDRFRKVGSDVAIMADEMQPRILTEASTTASGVGRCNEASRLTQAHLPPQRGDRSGDFHLALAHCSEQTGVVADRSVTVRMGVAGVALEGEEDHQEPAHQRFRLAEPVGGLQQWARLLRRIATFGWSLPKLASSMASARRISGSASPSRLVACSNCGEVVEVASRRSDGPCRSSPRRWRARGASAVPPRRAGWWLAATRRGC